MNRKKIYDCIVIGAGASGLFFAANAVNPCCGLVLEKTNRIGTKVLMSGGGHCNITHAGSIKDFIPCYGESGKAIRKILYRHNNLELIDFLESKGVPTIEEDGGRIFPRSKKASHVVDMLTEAATKNGFEIITGAGVSSIDRANDTWSITCESGDSYMSRNVVVATGGRSYPKTGSDGSMFEILKRDLGVEVTDLRPALCPIKVSNYPYKDIAGVSVHALISLSSKQKSPGPILFTHNGFSGPAAINLSGNLSKGDTIRINYLYPLTFESAFERINTATNGSKAALASILSSEFGLPKSFCKIISERAANSTKKAAGILSGDEFTVRGGGSFDEAMVTRGGVALRDVDLNSLELKAHPGIYIIGEALDVDGISGGYNLQFAYSSARAAADSIFGE